MSWIINVGTNIGRLLRKYLGEVSDHNEIISNSTNKMTYMEINPTLTVQSIYTDTHLLYEKHLKLYTQFKTDGHELTCETERWNRKDCGHLALEERVCICVEV